MAKHKILIVSVVCFSVVLAGQRPSYMPPEIPLPKPGMTSEERNKQIKEWLDQQRRQERERTKESMDLMARQAWIRLLRVSERQWNLIEPKYRKVCDIELEIWTGAKGSSGSDEKGFRWLRRSKSDSFRDANAAGEMTECERIAEELIELLEDEKSTDEAIKQKIDALQQFREKARKALPMAKQELSKVLTTPRQEAVFILMGYID
jgi:hypothetical protein